MGRFRCNTCSGEYRDILPDGTQYFHACPPERDPSRPTPVPDDEDTRPLIERADKRDENLFAATRPEAGQRMISAGRGRTLLPDVEVPTS